MCFSLSSESKLHNFFCREIEQNLLYKDTLQQHMQPQHSQYTYNTNTAVTMTGFWHGIGQAST